MNFSLLVVDDYEPWRWFVRKTLEKRVEWSVTEASDGYDAVQKAVQHQPDLIVLDIGMPNLNGIEAARQILEGTAKPKILFLSENRTWEVVQEGLSTGASGYVVKSSAARELWPAIKAVLRGEAYLSSCLCEDSGHPAIDLPCPLGAEKFSRAQ